MSADEGIVNRLPETSSTAMMQAARILIVDDDALIRDIASRKLSSQGYECETCTDEKTALRILSAKRFDLVLAGILGADNRRNSVVKKILRICPDVAVVLLTSVIDINLAVNSLKDGACDYITKPCSPDEISIRVSRALEKRRLLQENENYQRTLEEQVAGRTRQLKEALGVLEQTYHSTLVALSRALDSRNADHDNHSVRLTALSVRLARHLGLSQSEIKVIEGGVLLHDIGIIGIPDELLHKTGALSEQEQIVLQRHPIIGYQILSSIKFLKKSALLVLHHHERYDGKGYPQGLKGDEINPGARIFAIAEEFEKLVSGCRRRKTPSFKSAVREIKKMSGTVLDPGIVKEFVKIPVSEWGKVYREIPPHPATAARSHRHSNPPIPLR